MVGYGGGWLAVPGVVGVKGWWGQRGSGGMGKVLVPGVVGSRGSKGLGWWVLRVVVKR